MNIWTNIYYKIGSKWRLGTHESGIFFLYVILYTDGRKIIILDLLDVDKSLLSMWWKCDKKINRYYESFSSRMTIRGEGRIL